MHDGFFTEKPFCQAAFRSLSYEGGDGTDDYLQTEEDSPDDEEPQRCACG